MHPGEAGAPNAGLSSLTPQVASPKTAKDRAQRKTPASTFVSAFLCVTFASSAFAVAFGLRQPRQPKTGSAKKNSSKKWKIFARKNVVSKHHVYHAIHHTFTTKTPQPAQPFSQKPLQKRLFATAKKNYGRYFAGIGLVGDSESQKIFTTQ